jgi:hypothetical protein
MKVMQQQDYQLILKVVQNQVQQKEIVLVAMPVMDVEVIEFVHVVLMVLHLNEIEKIEQQLLLTMDIKIIMLTIVCYDNFNLK